VTSSDFANAWAIAASSTAEGERHTRLHPTLPVFVSCTQPGAFPGLLVDLDSSVDVDFGSVRGSDRIVLERSPGGVRLAAVHPDAVEVFLAAAPDIVEHVLDTDNPHMAASTLVQRFAHWQRLLRRSSGQLLSESKRLGLFGELVTLRDLMIPNLGAEEATSSWTGPAALPQDFQVGGLAVEVKSIVHSEPQKLIIDGERQLDPTGLDALVVAHHRLLRHRQSGQTLPAIIDELRTLFAGSLGAQDRFSDGLTAYGYHDDDAEEYTQTGYTVSESRCYRVSDGFPSIIEPDLADGIGNVTYSVDASACVQFEVDPSEVADWISNPAGIPTA
jgi:hypothetical protein